MTKLLDMLNSDICIAYLKKISERLKSEIFKNISLDR